MAWGSGRRVCDTCGQSIVHLKDYLPTQELRGPRNINPSNLDRVFDDRGRRFLVIEEKRPTEHVGGGQRGLLIALSRLPMFTVWLARGTPGSIEITDFGSPEPWPFAEGIDFDRYQALVNEWFSSAKAVSA